MAIKPLKGINFPGLEDTYVVDAYSRAETDSKLANKLDRVIYGDNTFWTTTKSNYLRERLNSLQAVVNGEASLLSDALLFPARINAGFDVIAEADELINDSGADLLISASAQYQAADGGVRIQFSVDGNTVVQLRQGINEFGMEFSAPASFIWPIGSKLTAKAVAVTDVPVTLAMTAYNVSTSTILAAEQFGYNTDTGELVYSGEYPCVWAGAEKIATSITIEELESRLRDEFEDRLKNKQDSLISGTNIKTVNGESLLGEGNLPVGTIVGDADFWTQMSQIGYYQPMIQHLSMVAAGHVNASFDTTTARIWTMDNIPSTLIISESDNFVNVSTRDILIMASVAEANVPCTVSFYIDGMLVATATKADSVVAGAQSLVSFIWPNGGQLTVEAVSTVTNGPGAGILLAIQGYDASKGVLRSGQLGYNTTTGELKLCESIASTWEHATLAALSVAEGRLLSERISAITDNMEDLGGGDMMKATYDPDGDGKVLWAVLADNAQYADMASQAGNASYLGAIPASDYALKEHEHTIYATKIGDSAFWRGETVEIPSLEGLCLNGNPVHEIAFENDALKFKPTPSITSWLFMTEQDYFINDSGEDIRLTASYSIVPDGWNSQSFSYVNFYLDGVSAAQCADNNSELARVSFIWPQGSTLTAEILYDDAATFCANEYYPELRLEGHKCVMLAPGQVGYNTSTKEYVIAGEHACIWDQATRLNASNEIETPGDMLQSVYDKDNDGLVDLSKVAQYDANNNPLVQHVLDVTGENNKVTVTKAHGGTTSFDINNVVTINLPTLAQGATEFTSEQANLVKAAIEKLEQITLPVVMLTNGNETYPANCRKARNIYTFTAFKDLDVGNCTNLQYLYLRYNMTTNTITNSVSNGVIGDSGDWIDSLDGNDSQLIEDLCEALSGPCAANIAINASVGKTLKILKDYIEAKILLIDFPVLDQFAEEYSAVENAKIKAAIQKIEDSVGISVYLRTGDSAIYPAVYNKVGGRFYIKAFVPAESNEALALCTICYDLAADIIDADNTKYFYLGDFGDWMGNIGSDTDSDDIIDSVTAEDCQEIIDGLYACGNTIPNEQAIATIVDRLKLYIDGQDNTIKLDTNTLLGHLSDDKVSKSDIVNDLTSGGTSRPLSAAQGKLLNSSIKAISEVLDNVSELKNGEPVLTGPYNCHFEAHLPPVGDPETTHMENLYMDDLYDEMYDITKSGDVDSRDIIAAKCWTKYGIYYDNSVIYDFLNSKEKSSVTLEVDPTDSRKLISIKGTNMWGNQIEYNLLGLDAFGHVKSPFDSQPKLIWSGVCRDSTIEITCNDDFGSYAEYEKFYATKSLIIIGQIADNYETTVTTIPLNTFIESGGGYQVFSVKSASANNYYVIFVVTPKISAAGEAGDSLTDLGITGFDITVPDFAINDNEELGGLLGSSNNTGWIREVYIA